MGKIKEFFSNQRTDLEKVFRNYNITIIAAMVLSIFACIFNSFDYDYNRESISYKTVEYISVFLIIFVVGAILLETIYVTADGVRNGKALLIGSIINGCISLMWTVININVNSVAELFEFITTKDIAEMNIMKLFGVYMIIILGLSIYKIFKKTGIEFDVYMARIIFGLLKVWAVYFVLIFAIEMLFSIFDNLIFEIDYWEISEYIMILLAGFLFFPYTLMTITRTEEENSKFTKGFVNFLWLPIIYAAMAIIYLYIVRIIVEGELPLNEVFGYCAYIFMFGMPAWFMAYGFLRENDLKKGTESKYTRFVKHVKYAYIPLLILEIISMGIRIADYGFTESRYLAVVLIIAQTIYLAWELIGKLLKKKIGYENYIFVAMGILTIVLICPVLNLDKFCFISQRDRFEEAMESGDYYTAESSYSEIKYTPYGDKYIEDNYTTGEQYDLELLLKDYTQYTYSYYEYVTFSTYYNTKESIKIQGYTNLYSFDYDSGEMMADDLKDITIKFGENQEVCVDMTETVEYFKKKEEERGDESPDMGYYYLELSPNCCLVIERISFSYSFDGSEYRYLDLEGYVLTNEGGHNGQ